MSPSEFGAKPPARPLLLTRRVRASVFFARSLLLHTIPYFCPDSFLTIWNQCSSRYLVIAPPPASQQQQPLDDRKRRKTRTPVHSLRFASSPPNAPSSAFLLIATTHLRRLVAAGQIFRTREDAQLGRCDVTIGEAGRLRQSGKREMVEDNTPAVNLSIGKSMEGRKRAWKGGSS